MKKLSSVVILETEKFSKSVKKLKKRFRHVEDDCDQFVEHIEYYRSYDEKFTRTVWIS